MSHMRAMCPRAKSCCFRKSTLYFFSSPESCIIIRMYWHLWHLSIVCQSWHPFHEYIHWFHYLSCWNNYYISLADVTGMIENIKANDVGDSMCHTNAWNMGFVWDNQRCHRMKCWIESYMLCVCVSERKNPSSRSSVWLFIRNISILSLFSYTLQRHCFCANATLHITVLTYTHRKLALKSFAGAQNNWSIN